METELDGAVEEERRLRSAATKQQQRAVVWAGDAVERALARWPDTTLRSAQCPDDAIIEHAAVVTGHFEESPLVGNIRHSAVVVKYRSPGEGGEAGVAIIEMEFRTVPLNTSRDPLFIQMLQNPQ